MTLPSAPSVPGYPVLLRLDGRRCVVVGGGTVALRKVRGLLECGALVTAISPTLVPELATLSDNNRIDVIYSLYESGILPPLRPFLVFAATDLQDVNRQVAADASALGALTDSVDDTAGDFSTMAVTRRGELSIALGSGGASPALVAYLRQQLEALIGPEYAVLAGWMADSLAYVKSAITTQTDRADLWRRVVTSSILAELRAGNEAAARQTFERLIDDALAQAAE